MNSLPEGIAGNFSFALITDLHVGNPGNDEDLRLTIQDINSLDDIDFVIASGDITESGSLKELQSARKPDLVHAIAG